MNDFDTLALHRAMDAQRIERGLSWNRVAAEIWDMSRELNAQRADHPISPATISGMPKRADTSCQHALFFVRWLGRSPESFLRVPPADLSATALPPVGSDRRLRWDLKALHAALDERRRAKDLTWKDVARELGCRDNQLTGLRTAKFATSMRLAMRIVQWLGEPAAAFVYPARW